MEIFNHLRRSFLVLTFILFALCMLILVASEAAWLGRMVEAWMESKPYPSFSLLSPMMSDSSPWYTQITHFLTFISGLGIFVICGALMVNPEINTKGKILLSSIIITSSILMPLVALIIGTSIVVALISLVMYLICLATFSILRLLTKEKLLLTTLAAIVGSSINFVYQVFQPTQHSVALLIMSFFAFGMMGSLLEYLWTSKWWQRDFDRVIRESIDTYASWRRQRQRQHRY